MAELLRQYLCCCLPQARPVHDTERQPLLDPDVLPQAPPRAPPTRTTEEQEAEQALRRRILNQASERLINILSPNPFTSTPTPSRDDLDEPDSPRSSSSLRSSSPPDSHSSSPTLTASSRIAPRSKHRSPHRRPVDTWRPSTHDPIAPVRVVHLGTNWEILDNLDDLEPRNDPSVTPSTLRRQQGSHHSSSGKKNGKGVRPPSSHSMRTLPRGGSSSNQPSPLRGHSHLTSGGEGDEGGVQLIEEGESAQEDGEDGDSKFGTATSYRTAASGRSTARGSRLGLRDIWGTAMSEQDHDESVVDVDPRQQQELEEAVARLEASIDGWKLQPVGPIVADLADYKPAK